MSRCRTASVEEVRRSFARAWGEIGAAWGVAPSTATVQGYLLAHGGPLSEPEMRRALGLSHRAASLALAQCEDWGLIRRARGRAPPRSARPGRDRLGMVGDHWEWFRRVAAGAPGTRDGSGGPGHRALRGARREPPARRAPTWSAAWRELLEFVRRFDRGVDILVQGKPRSIARRLRRPRPAGWANGRRLWALVDELEPDELAAALRDARQAAAGRGPSAHCHRRQSAAAQAAGPARRAYSPEPSSSKTAAPAVTAAAGLAAQRSRQGTRQVRRRDVLVHQAAGARDLELVEELAELGAQVGADLRHARRQAASRAAA